MKLTELKQGKTATISHVHLSGDIRQRLLDFGMVQHTPVTRLQTAPGGDPTAYMIRGTVIALRKNDAEKIQIN